MEIQIDILKRLIKAYQERTAICMFQLPVLPKKIPSPVIVNKRPLAQYILKSVSTGKEIWVHYELFDKGE